MAHSSKYQKFSKNRNYLLFMIDDLIYRRAYEYRTVCARFGVFGVNDLCRVLNDNER
jgi:hypothetical protein